MFNFLAMKKIKQGESGSNLDRGWEDNFNGSLVGKGKLLLFSNNFCHGSLLWPCWASCGTLNIPAKQDPDSEGPWELF